MSETDVLEEGAVVETATSGKPKQTMALPEVCYACGEKVAGAFCYRCGQKNDDCRRSIFSLIGETLSSVFSLDSKFLRTLVFALTRPGRYVRDYGDGRRSRFTPPVRFFLVISFAFFALLALTDTYFLTLKPERLPEGETASGVAATFTDTEGKRTSIDFNIQFFQKPEDVNFSDAEAEAIRDLVVESFTDDEAFQETDGDAVTVEEAELLAGSINQVAANPKPFNIALNSWLPRLMFIMTPFMAILGLVFIRGKDALVYDHLILSLNFHAVMFLTLIGSVLASSFIPGNIIGPAFVLLMIIYYLLTIRGTFNRGWIKSVSATIFVFLFYSLVVFASLMVVSVIAIRDIT